MDYSSAFPTLMGTRAITIPVPNGASSSSIVSRGQISRRRESHGYRSDNQQRTDLDVGNTSESSLGSDWTLSPASVGRSGDTSRARLQITMPSPPLTHGLSSTFASQSARKDKQRAQTGDTTTAIRPLLTFSPSSLGPSMLSSSAYKSVNLNSHHDPQSKEPARLITYTKHSQGFTWNDELFLPSYLLGRHRYRGHTGSSRRRWGGDDDDEIGDFDEEGERCPVTDIFVTDEEAAAMMP